MKHLKPFHILVLIITTGALINFLTYRFTQDYAGPITAVSVFLICTFILKQRGLSWSEYGLRKPDKPLKLFWQVPLTLVLTISAGILARITFAAIFGEPPVDQSRFEGMEGNVLMFAKWVVIGWIVGGFMEELIFRGFLLNTFENFFSSQKYASILAVISQGLLFGLVHFYNRGIVGALVIFSVSIVLGFLYLKYKRNLWPLILAHGIVDTLSFLENFLGA